MVILAANGVADEDSGVTELLTRTRGSGTVASMSEATKDRDTSKGGFSSRWILDGGRRPATVAGDARASAQAIDTNGDGVADTLAVRVDADRQTFLGRLGTLVARSLVTIVLVAAIVVAVAAATNLMQTRVTLEGVTAERDAARTEIAELRSDLDTAQAKVARLERAAAGVTGDATRIETERDELELEVRVLRRMLLDAERRAASNSR